MAGGVDYREDPFQRIVSVGWGSLWAVLQFRSLCVSGVSQTRGISLQLPQFNPAVVPLIVSLDGSFHSETTSTIEVGADTITTYSYILTSPDSFASGDDLVITSGPGGTFWAVTTSGGAGGLEAAQAYFFSLGWTTFSPTQTGQTTGGGHSQTIYTDTDRSVLLISLQKARQLIPSIELLRLSFSTGSPPIAIEGAPGAVSWDWTSIIGTYRGATANSFPLAAGLPNNWKPSEHERSDVGSDNETIQYDINMDMLTISRV